MEPNFWAEAFDQANQPTTITENAPEEVALDLELDSMGLLNVGQLTEEVIVYGHRILLRTLRMGEELEVSLLAQRYVGSQDEYRAYFTAIVAAAIVSVDGNPLVISFSVNDSLIIQKFEFIKENWHWPVIRAIYEQYVEIQKRVEDSLEEVKKN